MTRVEWVSQLKILVALHNGDEASTLQQELTSLGHRVQLCHELTESLRWLREWQPDLLVTEESLGRDQPDAGLRLAECCRAMEDQINGGPQIRTLLFILFPDWDHFIRARRTGANVIVKGANFEAAIRYTQTIADNLTTDRMLGPVLFGIHRFRGPAPHPKCNSCEWVEARVSYGSSQTDLEDLTPVRIGLLNILLFRRRGQSSIAIANTSRDSLFLKKVLRGHTFDESAVRMEACRLRKHIDEALTAIGAPYPGEHFLPHVPHGVKMYSLAGHRRLIHIPSIHDGKGEGRQ